MRKVKITIIAILLVAIIALIPWFNGEANKHKDIYGDNLELKTNSLLLESEFKNCDGMPFSINGVIPYSFDYIYICIEPMTGKEIKEMTEVDFDFINKTDETFQMFTTKDGKLNGIIAGAIDDVKMNFNFREGYDYAMSRISVDDNATFFIEKDQDGIFQLRFY